MAILQTSYDKRSAMSLQALNMIHATKEKSVGWNQFNG